ncbi:hypothetical protein [Nocardiopsis sp. TNDT3]|uniref:hypothetical protein n=1 Tax=Nocardiopsis sp. TNDT3 TaxID=2249354 RepID=UPI000E3D0AC8|nr:hypothetical protein [Nocardiopsis sp. TNDT3]
MADHTEDCYLDPAHHVCAVARAGRAEGALGEARAVAADALASLRDAGVDQAALTRVHALVTEFERDLEVKGEDWHPRTRSLATQVIAQLRAALSDTAGSG